MNSFSGANLGADSPTLTRTKLQRPTIGPDILPHAQLAEWLEEDRYGKHTIISAPQAPANLIWP